MFVLEALTLTFLTTPLVSALYPPERRVRVSDLTSANALDGLEEDRKSQDRMSLITDHHPWRHRFTVVLDKLDHIPGVMALTQLILPPPSSPSGVASVTTTTDTAPLKNFEVNVDALRLIELSDRTSAVMKSSVADSLLHTDPLLGIFRMFGELNNLPISTSLSVVPYDDLAYSLTDHAKRHSSQLILLPWLPPTAHSNTMEPEIGNVTPKINKLDHNPFDAFFGSAPKADKSASAIHSQFVRGVFAQSKTDVAVFIDTGDRSGAGGSQHIFFPFFGGPDDRLALEFVVQLCFNPKMTATVVRFMKRDVGADAVERPSLARLDEKAGGASLAIIGAREHGHTVTSTIGLPDTVYGQPTTQTRLQSETADNMTWSRYAFPTFENEGPSSPLRSGLSRIEFSDLSTPVPLHAAIQRAAELRERHTRLLIVAGRSRRLATENHHHELKELFEEHRSVGQEVVKKTIGDVATAMVVAGSASSMVVIQAANVSLD